MKKILLILAIVVNALALQAQGIYNDGARIVGEGGASWVVSGGNFTLTSTNAVDPATIDNLKIEAGASLTLPATTCLTVNSTLANAAGTTGLVVKSDITNTGSLKILLNTTAMGTIQRYMSASAWHIVSAPTTENLIAFFGRNLVIPALNGTATLGMMDYNTGGNNWNAYLIGGIGGTAGSLVSGKGYLVRTETPVVAAPTILDFQGALKAGPNNVTVTSGWNCIGNPFTSSIQVSNGSNSFLAVNTTKLAPTIDPNNIGVYFWNDVSKKYDVINELDGATYAQSGQGFFVKAITGLVTEGGGKNDFVSFTPAMQVHQVAQVFKLATVAYPSIKLMATQNAEQVSTDIKFVDGSTIGLDKGYDAGILKAGATFSLYTRLVEDNGIEFQLQCLPPSGYDKMVIPVGIDSKTGGEMVLSVNTVQLDPTCKVILEDKLNNTYTDLSKGSYKAAVVANTAGTGRFFLHTGDIVSGIDDQVLAGKVTAYAKGNKEIRVLGEVGDGAVATLVNGLGQVVLTKKLGAGNLNIIGLPNLNSGFYLLNINDKSTTQTIKILIR